MADITMCMGEECPLKEKCFRFLATPEQNLDMQTYFAKPPFEGDECKMFWSIEED